ncbi:MAG: excinuclease ABC subunit UvrB [Acidobacteria bacterium]|nr:excinuclease ABC subunit UvrB [Acidobacteriota bacterium]
MNEHPDTDEHGLKALSYQGIAYGGALGRSRPFRLASDFVPRGDQARAVRTLADNLAAGVPHQVLLGVTGSGKTYSMARIIAATGRPALVLAHNKTLAAQLYHEFRSFFPDNAVEYFISYYDYYQPEAYIPASDTYIEKDVQINEEIDRLRHSATRSLFERRDCIIVASVSCIYGLGSPEAYFGMVLFLETGQTLDRHEFLHRLVELQYARNDFAPGVGNFRARGDTVDIFPPYGEGMVRVSFFGDEIEDLCLADPLTGAVLSRHERLPVYPKSHYVIPRSRWDAAVASIKAELKEAEARFQAESKFLEHQRIHERTLFDLEMIKELGYCRGIENYSRHLTGRRPGEPPPTLLDYLPKDHLVFVDESHVTLPQVRGMFNGDRSRKTTLVEHGFRLPSALDNRPLNFDEFRARINQVIYVSATPARYEIELSESRVAEQLVRPTGLLDPAVEVRPTKGQMDDLYAEIRRRADRGERVLVTTLTKKMAEDLADYFRELGLRVAWLHSDVESLERIRILRDLRAGVFDVLVGINLLREGLDLPEVSLVAILDADKEGFLRSRSSLIQTMGRAARHVNGTAILYADEVTESMNLAVEETYRRRSLQEAFNREHGITPESVVKPLNEELVRICNADYVDLTAALGPAEGFRSAEEVAAEIAELEKRMKEASGRLEFEKAAGFRDRIRDLRKVLMEALENEAMAIPLPESDPDRGPGRGGRRRGRRI